MLTRLRKLVSPPPVIEQRAALLAGKHITYILKRSSKRRSIGLRIDDRGLTVSMPLRASEKWLHSVLQDKAFWVVEKLAGWQKRVVSKVCWVDGETIPYRGTLLTLRVQVDSLAGAAQQYGDELWVYVTDAQDAAAVEQSVNVWYQQQALPLFLERVNYYAPLLQVQPRKVQLSNAKTQWGCCTARGTVRLNLQLIKQPLPLLDYVVVHELAHLREMNHSAAFWAVVSSQCADYADKRKQLRRVSLR